MKTDVAMRLRCQPVSQASGTVNTPMTTGIITMRSQVRRFGTLSGMELPVDLLGELAADALDLRQVLHARAHARDPLERGRGAALRAAGAMPGDGEAVRLVADLLDEVQPRMVRRQPHRLSSDPQLLQARLALGR